ncbi:hypothetical protein PUN28_012889 [Cardiocondyla obscurior]|uniref:Peptidase S1 domain-containing protein n=1 Tax=Cardiocondyla obscurior TaxID=286306 RepID=A0AAW2F9T7_9HYME
MNASINAVSPLALNFEGKRYVTAANQRDHPEFRGSRRSLSDHSWCKRKILVPSTPDSTDTLQSEFRFGALGTKGSRRKLTKETVRRPGEAAEVPLTIPGTRENSSTYPVLQIALTLCRVWRFGDERFATKTNQGNRPETREAAEVPLTIPGTRENSSTYPVLQIALTLCRVNSGLALWGRKVWRFGDERFATETNQGNRPETRGSRKSLSDHSWCKRKILDVLSTLDSTNTLQNFCDSFLVIGVLRGSQKFHCTSTACENSSAFSSSAPLDFLSNLNLLLAAQKVPRFLVIGVLRGLQKFHCASTAWQNSSAYFWTKCFKSDSFLVIGVLRGSQKFHCTSTACENSSAYSSSAPDRFLVIGVLRGSQKFHCASTAWQNSSAYSSTNIKGSDDLLKVILRLVSHESCKASFFDGISLALPQGIVDDWQICAGEDGKDTCQGDSGEPLSIFGTVHQCLYTVIGITSLGKACGDITPGVYTRVYHYIPWIEKIVWSEYFNISSNISSNQN